MPSTPDSALDRLTNPKLYTGSHQHRFDNDGKGRGLAGRDRIIKGAGTVEMATTSGPVRDIAQLMRPNLRGGDTSKSRPSSGKPKASKKVDDDDDAASKPRSRAVCRDTSCTNRASPTSTQGFCSYHSWKEKEAAPYPNGGGRRGSAGDSQENGDSIGSLPEKKASTAPKHRRTLSSLCSVKECGNDRSSTSLSGYCSFHAWKNGEIDKPNATALQEAELFEKDSTAVTQACNLCKEPRFKMGYCLKHFEDMMNEDEEAPTCKSASKIVNPDATLDRLTNPKLFTGSHQHRFDEAGKGRGKAGRDAPIKGVGAGARGVGDKVHDLSQILRPNL